MLTFKDQVVDVISRFEAAYLLNKLAGDPLVFEDFVSADEFVGFRASLEDLSVTHGESINAILYQNMTEAQRNRSGAIFREKNANAVARFQQSVNSGDYDYFMGYAGSFGTVGDIADMIFSKDFPKLHGVCGIHHVQAILRDYLGKSPKSWIDIPQLEQVVESIPVPIFEQFPSLNNIFFGIERRRYMASINEALSDHSLTHDPVTYNDVARDSISKVISELEEEVAIGANQIANNIRRKVIDYFSSLLNFSISNVVDDINGKVFPSIHQREGIIFIYNEKKVLIADEMGTGKTAQAVLGASYVEQMDNKSLKTLIVVPNSVKQTIRDEIYKYMPHLQPEDIVILNGADREKALEQAKKAKFVIINYELIHRSSWTSEDMEETDLLEPYLKTSKADVERICARAIRAESDELHAVQTLCRKESRGKLNNGEYVPESIDDAVNLLARIRKLEDDTRLVDRLHKLGFNYVVFDEIHNAKNLERYTTKAVRRLAAKAEYLVLLSGTPVPNGMQDLEVIFELLGLYASEDIKSQIRKKKGYAPDKKVKVRFVDVYEEDPRWIRDVLRRKMLRRRSDEVLDLPPLIVEDLEITLSHAHRQVYQALLDNDYISKSSKLIALRKCLLDPCLLLNKNRECYLVHSPSVLAMLRSGVESQKYKVLDGLLEQCDGKFVVFTSMLKQGVTTYIENRFKDKYGMLRIDGDVNDSIKSWSDENIGELASRIGADERHVLEVVAGADYKISERELVRRLFIGYDEYQGLVATTRTMREGVDLSAANYAFFVDKPYTFSEFQQCIKREHRENQKRPVHVVSIVARDSVDIGINHLTDEKRRIGELIIDGAELSPEEKEIANSKGKLVRPIKRYLEPENRALLKLFGLLHCAGADRAKQLLVDDKVLAELYADNYVGNLYALHAAHFVKRIFDNVDPGKVLDLASGYGYVSQISGIKTVNLELNPYMIRRAKEICPQSSNVQGLMQNLPFSKSFDSVVYNLALHYASSDEVGRIFDEVGAVLKDGGRLVLTVPRSRIDVQGAEDLENMLFQKGFITDKKFTGFFKNSSESFNVYAYVGVLSEHVPGNNPSLELIHEAVAYDKIPIEYDRQASTHTGVEPTLDIDFRKYKPRRKKHEPRVEKLKEGKDYGLSWVHNPDGTIEVIR